ncbi:trehalose-phosphatase [Geminicoccaceae bacterium 1502E]|nr:trehalose-phosphatase [Geminicoccaceae bacterium 1502E]
MTDMHAAEETAGLPPAPATGAAPPPSLPDLAQLALFLDFDGTLVHLAERPGDVHAPDELIEALGRLAGRLDGALAIVTGRPSADIDHFLEPLVLTVAGVHGLERRFADGRRERHERVDLLDPLRGEAAALAAGTPGLLVEDKEVSLAVHYRQAPDAEAAVLALAERALQRGPGLKLLRGKMVVELMPEGVDKGTAIAELLKEPPFAGRSPVFAGDDVTDEAGFALVNAQGGTSIRVGRDGRPSEARHGLADVDELRAWLRTLLD